MYELSKRTSNFSDSVIRRMTRIANKYDAVNLSQGFPDFAPPKEITDRLAGKNGATSICNYMGCTKFS
jgi:aminotransferase